MSKRFRAASKPNHGSRVFDAFRTVGVVTNNVPAIVTTLGQSFVITTVVGRAFQLWDAANLHLLFVSQPATSEDIDCIASHYHYTFVGCGNNIQLYKRARLVTSSSWSGSERARKIVVFGEYVCVVTSKQLHVFKWTPTSIVLYTTVSVPSVLGPLQDAAHPATYLNKIVIATVSCLVLINVKTGKIIHTFDDVPAGLTGVTSSPTALDVIAAVAGDGTIHLVNLRTAKTLYQLSVGETVTAIGFRTDGVPLLGVGTTSGDVLIYDLDARRRVQSLRSLHGNQPVSTVEFLAGQPLCLTTSGDNQVIELAFDPPTSGSVASGAGRARILRRRGGHAQPPSLLEFADPAAASSGESWGDSSFVLSASLDASLWSFSLRKDSQSYRYSTGKTVVDIPAVVDIAYNREKQERWPTLLTVHQGENFARAWSAPRGKLEDLTLASCDGDLVKVVSISSCGNFGIVGSADGGIAVYNLQSGRLRWRTSAVHRFSLSSLNVDPTNTMLISSGLDGRVVWTDFRTGKKANEVDLGSAIARARYHPGSGLLATILDSMTITVVDTATQKIVRRLRGHGNRVTSCDWSPDSRLLISASLDSTVRTWDVPSGGCVDAVSLAVPVTCLRLSPGGEWMATTHVNGLGIQLWSMRTQFAPPPSRLISEAELERIQTLALPSIAGSGAAVLVGDYETETASEEIVDIEAEWDPPSQISPSSETLSGQPPAKFATLLSLDVIRERNKPVEPPKKPEAAPFFLGLRTPENNSEKSEDMSQKLVPKDYNGESHFTSLLKRGQLVDLLDHLATLGPAATDLEIRSLDTSAPYSEIVAFLDALTKSLERREKYELVQAWAKLLFDAHPDLMNESPIKESVDRWLMVQSSELARIQDLQRFCGGVLTYLRTL